MLRTRLFIPIVMGAMMVCLPSLGRLSPAQLPTPEGSPRSAQPSEDGARKKVKGGIAVELSIEPLNDQKKAMFELLEEDVVRLGFRITDTATGATLSGLRPAAWLDHREARKVLAKNEVPAGTSCQEKIKWFLQGSLSLQPSMDLNTYFILALNDKPSISVINPQLGFYISKLTTSIPLKNRGEDWVLTRDGKRLFVTLPQVHQVAVINTQTWKVEANIDAGVNPVRVALQPDEKYLWVGNDVTGGAHAGGGVTIIDPAELQVLGHVPTGAGHHELAFSDDSGTAFATNKDDGTLTVMDVGKLAKIKEVKTGAQPVAAAFSRQARAVYVAHEEDGRIAVVGGKDHQLLTRIAALPGLRALRFNPDGRWGFALNYRENVVNIVDSALNRIIHTVAVDPEPDHVSFSPAFAYIRSAGSNRVNMIQLSHLGKEESLSAVKIPGGQSAPRQSAHPSSADAIVPTPEVDVVLVANPVDMTIYYHMEGMLAPMGSFQNYGSEPRAVLVVDRSLRETAPGFYTTTFALPPSGIYDVAFLLDAPRVDNCFEVEVKQNPARAASRDKEPPRIEVTLQQTEVKAGEAARVRFLVAHTQTGQPLSGLKDLRVLFFTPTDNWQKRVHAQAADEGVYETEVVLPLPGIYYVFFESPSIKLRYDQAPHLVLKALDKGSDGSIRSDSGPAVGDKGQGK